MIIKPLLLLAFISSININSCNNDSINEIVIYTLPMNAMYYGSMDENALMKESDKEMYSLNSKNVLSSFNLMYNKIDVDSLFNPKFQRLDLKVLIEIHFKNTGVFKIGLNMCGDYIIFDKKRVFYRYEELINLIETNVPQIKFAKCNYQNR